LLIATTIAIKMILKLFFNLIFATTITTTKAILIAIKTILILFFNSILLIKTTIILRLKVIFSTILFFAIIIVNVLIK